MGRRFFPRHSIEKSMGYRVCLSRNRHAVVLLTYSGPVTIEERAAALQEVLRLLGKTWFNRLLVDFEHGRVVPASFEANNRHAADLARAYAGLPGWRIAYVSVPDPNTTPIVETLAAARGFYYERFVDKKSALEWLE
jgi:hypothetical protein